MKLVYNPAIHNLMKNQMVRMVKFIVSTVITFTTANFLFFSSIQSAAQTCKHKMAPTYLKLKYWQQVGEHPETLEKFPCVQGGFYDLFMYDPMKKKKKILESALPMQKISWFGTQHE